MAELPPTAYGVWIDDAGWLRNPDTQEAFAAFDRALAEAAAELWGVGATVLPIDKSLSDLQGLFLAQQQANARAQAATKRKGIFAWRI